MLLARLQMSDDEHLSALFEKNRESRLTRAERAKLNKAVRLSQLATLRKAIGIVEAMKRGLINSPAELEG